MSTANNASPVMAPPVPHAPPRPHVITMLGGEVLKLRRMWLVWVCLVAYSAVIALPLVIALGSRGAIANSHIATAPAAAQLLVLYHVLGTLGFLLRFFGAPIVLLVTTRLIGMEYSSGTIRLILARGVGRVPLLALKVAVSLGVALAVVVWGIVLAVVATDLALLLIFGNLSMLSAATPDFWRAAGDEAIVLVLSFVVMVLLATALTVLSRSLAFGLAAAFAWYFVDNLIGTVFFTLGYLVTKSDGWLLATGDLLGPNLNSLANTLLPPSATAAQVAFLGTPLTPVTSGHSLLVVTIYVVIFVAVSVALIARRDVQE